MYCGRGQPLLPAEEVTSRSGLGAHTITSFLFEHYLHFTASHAIADAAAIADNFSDAICMLGQASNDTGTFGASLTVAHHHHRVSLHMMFTTHCTACCTPFAAWMACGGLHEAWQSVGAPSCALEYSRMQL